MFVKKLIKEACVETIAQALKAEKSGADRVEYCHNLDMGGSTPTRADVQELLERLSIPIAVMIRPRKQSFVYTHSDIDIMCREIQAFKAMGVKHVVFGALTANFLVDRNACEKLLKYCNGLTVTFHRAFDDIDDMFEALETIIELGFHKILTSGGQGTAILGKETIFKLLAAADNRIDIIAGSGLTQENLLKFCEELPINEVHGTKIVSM